MVDLLHSSKLKVSPEPVVATSSLDIAVDVTKALRLTGISMEANCIAKDLGIDAAGGRVRRTKVSAKRIKTAALRVAKIKVFKHFLKAKDAQAPTRSRQHA